MSDENAYGRGLSREVLEMQRLENSVTAAALDAAGIPEPILNMWVIYERPRDYPTSYVVRRHAITHKGSHAMPEHSIHATLEEARAAVPPWTIRLERDPNDEPQIVECWI